jgi:hypothetical protein
MKLTYEYATPKLLKVMGDGAFLGFLERSVRRAATGLNREPFLIWSGNIGGVHIHANTVRGAKAKITTASRQTVTVCESHYDDSDERKEG